MLKERKATLLSFSPFAQFVTVVGPQALIALAGHGGIVATTLEYLTTGRACVIPVGPEFDRLFGNLLHTQPPLCGARILAAGH